MFSSINFMNSKQQIFFILVFVLAGIIWLYLVRLFINSFMPPFQDPIGSFDDFKFQHFIYGLSVFLPLSIVILRLKSKILRRDYKNKFIVDFLYSFWGFFFVCYFTFCAIPLLSFQSQGFRVFFDMIITTLGLPVYVLFIFASSPSSAIELVLKTLIFAFVFGVISVLISNFAKFKHTNFPN